MELKFLICEHCGNIVSVIKGSGVPVKCCGEDMKELVAGAKDGAKEKHVPVYQVEGNQVTVCVGSVEHPMQQEQSIEWIAVQTRQGAQFKKLDPGCAPKAGFALCDGDEVEAVYAYCNLHGLWKA